MANALNDLGLEKIFVIHPGIRRYPLHEKIEAVPIRLIDSIEFELDTP